MKNLINKFRIFLGLVLVSALLVALHSCKKEVSENLEPQVVSEEINGFLKYRLNKSALIRNEQDKEDEAINVKLVEIAEKLQPVLLNAKVRREIIALSKEGDQGFVSLRKLTEVFPSIHVAIGENSINDGKYLFSHQGTNYEPVINIPNFAHADFLSNPLVSPGIEVEDDPARGINDYIFSWALDDYGVYAEVAIGEAQVKKMKNPLFVVTPHPVGEGINNNDVVSSVPTPSVNLIEFRANTAYFFDRLRVNHAYESSGNSEVWIQNYRIDENGTHHWLPNSGGSDGKRMLAELSQNQIGVTQTIDISFLDPNGAQEEVTPASSNAAFFAVWERDWYSTNKDLGKICYNNKSLFFAGHRKYSNEWYSFDPGESDSGCSANTTIQESQINFNETMQDFNFQQNKGYLRLNYIE